MINTMGSLSNIKSRLLAYQSEIKEKHSESEKGNSDKVRKKCRISPFVYSSSDKGEGAKNRYYPYTDRAKA